MCSFKWKPKWNTRKLPFAIPSSAFSFCFFCFLYFPREGSCGKTMTAKWSTISEALFCHVYLLQIHEMTNTVISFNNLFQFYSHCFHSTTTKAITTATTKSGKLFTQQLMKLRNFLHNIFMLFSLSLFLLPSKK